MTAPKEIRWSVLFEALGWAALVLFAFLLRRVHFWPLAVHFDDVEYAYCIATNQFPHSPYIFFLWTGALIERFCSLDWGLAALSLTCSLLAPVLFGLVARKLTGCVWAGFVAGLVLAVAPVAIRYSGRQEVYAYLFFWIALSWFFGVVRGGSLLSGLALGAAFATHSGTLFAIPATALMFLESWRPETPAHDDTGNESVDRDAFWVWVEETREGFDLRLWSKCLLGFAIPVAVVFGWLLLVWIWTYGVGELGLLFLYLRGSAPPADFQIALFGEDPETATWAISAMFDNVGDQFERMWEDLGSGEVFTRGLVVCGLAGLLLGPFRTSAVWWALALPYLIYEIGAGRTLDVGIFSIFVLPSLAMGLARCAARVSYRGTRWRRIPAGVLLSIGLLFPIAHLPTLQREGFLRKLEPWTRAEGATMALARWVRKNTPEDALLINPVDWHYCGLAVPYYGGRRPIFRDGFLLDPGPRKVLFSGPEFDFLTKVNTAKLEERIAEGRPVLSFDPDPFRVFGAVWSEVDIDRFETRPVLWLDRNQTGTGLAWKDCDVVCEIDPRNRDHLKRWDVEIDRPFPLAAETASLFKPTLYYLSAIDAATTVPLWVEELRKKVPENRRGAPPVFEGEGVLTSEPVRFETPAVPGKDHVVRLVLHSAGPDYVVRCESRRDGDWETASYDMEKYVSKPEVFSELFFQIPGDRVEKDSLKIRLTPEGGTPYLNVFRIEVGVVRDE